MAECIALTHHERWDGRGYPRGLAGEQIPLPGRIVGAADVFDALAHARPYKPAWPVQEAVAEVLDHAGGQFDPDVVQVFAKLDHQALLSGARDWEPPAKPSLTRSQARLATHA
jgi:putative two-component system response regulator